MVSLYIWRDKTVLSMSHPSVNGVAGPGSATEEPGRGTVSAINIFTA